MKKVNISLPDDIHTQAKLIAVLKQKGLLKYIEETIMKAVENDRSLLEDVAKLGRKPKEDGQHE